MKVGWLMDDPGYLGGAELTAREFRVAAPDDVEVIDCRPGEVVPGLDRYVVHNCTHYLMEDATAFGSAPVVKYVHDLWPDGAELRTHLLERADLIFCSPLHREQFARRFPLKDPHSVIPPALDLRRFKPSRQVSRNGKRSGVCSVAGWRNPGKGGQQLAEWAKENGPVDVYGEGFFTPHGKNLDQKGPVDPSQVPQTLWGYETFVFLPFELEPFCRSVAEAWCAGLTVVTNGLVGALYWLREAPEKLKSAAGDFWEAVLA